MNRNTTLTNREEFEARLNLLTATYVAMGLAVDTARQAALADLLLFNPCNELSLAA